jgi:glutamate synthase (NADPH/NADH) large chain
VRLTASAVGRRILDNWELMVPRFIKVMPVDYRRVLQARRAEARPRRLSVVPGGAAPAAAAGGR